MTDKHNDQSVFTGRTRKKATSKGVVVAETLAQLLISVGGIGTIVAVLGVCFFLVSVVVPLFKSASVTEPVTTKHEWLQERDVVYSSIDDYQAMATVITDDGRAGTFRVDSGEIISENSLITSNRITSVFRRAGLDEVLFGLSDGSLALMKLEYSSSFRELNSLESAIRTKVSASEPGEAITFGKSIIQLTPEGQCRVLEFKFSTIKVVKVAETAIKSVSCVMRASGPMICYASSDNEKARLFMIMGSEEDDFLTGAKKFVFEDPVELAFPEQRPVPDFIEISGSGNDVYSAWKDGFVVRTRVENGAKSFLAETGRLTEDGVELTAMMFMLGDSTMVWGDSNGNIGGGFPIRLQEFSGDGLMDCWQDKRCQFKFAVTKKIGDGNVAVTTLSSSARTRTLFCGRADGKIEIFFVTSAAKMGETALAGKAPIREVYVSPKEDGFISLSGSEVYHFEFDPRYPEASFSSLFTPVWYEGYPKAIHMWQSEGGTEDIERKLGLVPLIFGTLKATLYAMLFGVPLALLAAVFSSEFMHASTKSVVKPLIEMMASLPSVVLGFLAALVFAPFVEEHILAVMLTFVMIPVSFLLAAYMWQMLPGPFVRSVDRFRILFCLVPAALGVLLAALLGPVVEGIFFSGDVKNWLSWSPQLVGEKGPHSSSLGGWFVLLLPLSAFITAFLVNRMVTPLLSRMSKRIDLKLVTVLDLVKFLAACAITCLIALGASYIMDIAKLDLRSDWIFGHTDLSPLDIYVQRNALIVGVVMGFAVIPIVYTISDDALAAVPDHLRSASLGAGATRWQTTVRIVMPTAMSGLFSAVMIGLGRAVGETMIVLMALGNTAIMDWNMFNGARTLSANIAVELPEAVKGSAHYRTLFLAALVLFVMTFVINSIAESVRLHFRKKAYQL